MKRKLGDILVGSGALTRADLDAALGDQRLGEPGRLGEMLIAWGKITPLQLALALSKQYGVPFTELPPVSRDVLDSVPLEIQQQYRFVPLKVEPGAITVALADLAQASSEIVPLLKRGYPTVHLFVASGDEIDALHTTLSGGIEEAPGVRLPSVAPAIAPVSPSTGASHEDLFADLSLPPPSEESISDAFELNVPDMSAPGAVGEEEPEFFEATAVPLGAGADGGGAPPLSMLDTYDMAASVMEEPVPVEALTVDTREVFEPEAEVEVDLGGGPADGGGLLEEAEPLEEIADAELVEDELARDGEEVPPQPLAGLFETPLDMGPPDETALQAIFAGQPAQRSPPAGAGPGGARTVFDAIPEEDIDLDRILGGPAASPPVRPPSSEGSGPEASGGFELDVTEVTDGAEPDGAPDAGELHEAGGPPLADEEAKGGPEADGPVERELSRPYPGELFDAGGAVGEQDGGQPEARGVGAVSDFFALGGAGGTQAMAGGFDASSGSLAEQSDAPFFESPGSSAAVAQLDDEVFVPGVPASSPSALAELHLTSDPPITGSPALPAWLEPPGGDRATWTGALDHLPPSRLIFAVTRVLVAKGLITEREILDADLKK